MGPAVVVQSSARLGSGTPPGFHWRRAVANVAIFKLKQPKSGFLKEKMEGQVATFGEQQQTREGPCSHYGIFRN